MNLKGHVSVVSKCLGSLMLATALFIMPIGVEAKSVNEKVVYKEATKGTIKKKLKKFKVLSGENEVDYEGLKLKVNDKLTEDGNSIKRFYPVKKQKYPVMTLTVYNESYDYSNFKDIVSKTKVKSYLEYSSVNDSKISKVKYTLKKLNDNEYYKINYNFKLSKKTKKVLSKKLKGSAAFIPTKKGMYIIKFENYTDDKNNYKFNEVLDTMDISGLYSYLDEKELQEKLDDLKEQTEKITVLAEANDQEKQIFDTRKQEVLNLIEQKASVEDIQKKIDELNQTNTDIQSRLDKEKAEKEAQINTLKSQINSINCVDGANDTERSIFNTRKTDAQNYANQSDADINELQSKVNQLNQTNMDIQNRIYNDQVAAQQAAAAAAAARQNSNSGGYYSGGSASNDTSGGGYYCVDGMYVGNANPHARGRANACYGHGGFAINH